MSDKTLLYMNASSSEGLHFILPSPHLHHHHPNIYNQVNWFITDTKTLYRGCIDNNCGSIWPPQFKGIQWQIVNSVGDEITQGHLYSSWFIIPTLNITWTLITLLPAPTPICSLCQLDGVSLSATQLLIHDWQWTRNKWSKAAPEKQ